MANGPMTEAEARQVEWAAVWRGLPDDMKAGLAKLEADHPGEVLSSVSGGAVEAVPEGRELTDWMDELAAAGGFGDIDENARRFNVETYWVDPIRPEADADFKVGFQVTCNLPEIGAYEVQVSVETMGRDAVQIASASFADVGTGDVTVPGVPAGQYVVIGQVNNGGVDQGSPPNEQGYRVPFSFSFQVGEFTEGRGLSELSMQLGSLASQLKMTEEPPDLADLVDAICKDLEAEELFRDKQDAIARARDYGARASNLGRDLNRSAVWEAGTALEGLATQLPAVQNDPQDRAALGVAFAYIDQFAIRVEEAVYPREE